MSAAEIKSIMALGNGGPGKAKTNDSLHSRFAQIARKFPDQVALCQNNRQLSYAMLDQQSENLSITMRASGVAAGSTVAVYFERSFAAYIAILAV